MRSGLTARQKVEESYHNEKYANDKHCHYRQGRTSNCYQYYFSLIKDVDGLNVLDFGCGNGWLSIHLAAKAANVWGIDISQNLITKANEYAASRNLTENTRFRKMAGENLAFPDEFFDLVLGSAILHHTDIKVAISQIYRVLKPSGKALFIEPLNQNIVLKIWRKLTPHRRSPEERALVSNDLEYIRAVFPSTKYTYFTFVSCLTTGLLTLFPNNIYLNEFDKILGNFDQSLLTKVPSLQKYSAVAVLELSKEIC